MHGTTVALDCASYFALTIVSAAGTDIESTPTANDANNVSTQEATSIITEKEAQGIKKRTLVPDSVKLDFVEMWAAFKEQSKVRAIASARTWQSQPHRL